MADDVTTQEEEEVVTEWVDSTVTETRTIRMSGVPPLRLYEDSATQFVPDYVEVRIVDGKWLAPQVSGRRLLRSGAVSEVAVHTRDMWRPEEWPQWLTAVINQQKESDHA
jgi:hypothetical protein